jgi:hypothetical protein
VRKKDRILITLNHKYYSLLSVYLNVGTLASLFFFYLFIYFIIINFTNQDGKKEKEEKALT